MPDELYPGHAAELARKAARDAEIASANRVPLPGPLLQAFTAPELQAHGLVFQSVVHAHHALLQQLDSPFLRNLNELAKPEDQRTPHEAQPEEVAEFVFLFTLPPREARKLIAAGRQAFRDAALAAISDRFHESVVLRMVIAAREHYLGSWATAVGYEARAAEDGTVFTPPPARPMTDSAGGCCISPV